MHMVELVKLTVSFLVNRINYAAIYISIFLSVPGGTSALVSSLHRFKISPEEKL